MADRSKQEDYLIWAYDSYVPIAERAVELYRESHTEVTFSVVGKEPTELWGDYALASERDERLPDLILAGDDDLRQHAGESAGF